MGFEQALWSAALSSSLSTTRQSVRRSGKKTRPSRQSHLIHQLCDFFGYADFSFEQDVGLFRAALRILHYLDAKQTRKHLAGGRTGQAKVSRLANDSPSSQPLGAVLNRIRVRPEISNSPGLGLPAGTRGPQQDIKHDLRRFVRHIYSLGAPGSDRQQLPCATLQGIRPLPAAQPRSEAERFLQPNRFFLEHRIKRPGCVHQPKASGQVRAGSRRVTHGAMARGDIASGEFEDAANLFARKRVVGLL